MTGSSRNQLIGDLVHVELPICIKKKKKKKNPELNRQLASPTASG